MKTREVILGILILGFSLSDGVSQYASTIAESRAQERELARLAARVRQSAAEKPGEWRRMSTGETNWTFESDWVEFNGRVISNHPEGMRIEGEYSFAGLRWDDPARFKGEFFVQGIPFKAAEDDHIGVSVRLRAKKMGLYTYTTILGAERSIRKLEYGVPVSGPSPRQPSAAEIAATAAAKTKAAEETELRLLAWQQQQAAAGAAHAQRDLGLRYLHGRGVETNLTTARAWLEKAAAQGDAEAKSALTSLSSR